MKWSEVAQLCPTLCDPMDCSLPGFSVHGILQARILEWVTISFSRGSSRPRDRTRVSHIVGRCFTVWATREAYTVCKIPFTQLLCAQHWILYMTLRVCCAKSLQSCPTLCNPVDCSLPGFSIHGILQARILEWVTISFFRWSLWPRDRTQVSCIVGRHFTIWATREV